MKKIYLLLSLQLLLISTSLFSNVIGSDMRIEETGTNLFQVYLQLVVDSTHTSPISYSCKIFEQTTNSLQSTTSLNLDSTITKSLVISDVSYKYKISYYSRNITLASNPNGYYATSSHCCRPTTKNHTNTGGSVFTCDIPNPAITGRNSNPKFADHPDSLFFYINLTTQFDFSCTDPDGDSLVYSLINPYESTSSSGAKPLSLLAFKPAFNLSNILGPGTILYINSATGIVTGRPASVGDYLMAVKCEEYRNGIKIGEVVREVVYPATNKITHIPENNLLNSNVTIYPNPNNGDFKVDFLSDNFKEASFSLYSTQGKLITTKQLNNMSNTIALDKITSGVYFAKISVKNEVVVKQIIIK